ncbi:MAG TPA: hypothetical protein VHR66_15845 [Gemmataceae bacterium]|jgi:predicted nucleic acid-binding protein|nr:hypothetical protein [Gemmataceae bacterium]
MNAVDTNVFVYSLDVDDPIKHAKAIELLQRLVTDAGSTVTPWQVAGEFLANLRKRESTKRITAQQVDSHFRNLLAMFPLANPLGSTVPDVL